MRCAAARTSAMVITAADYGEPSARALLLDLDHVLRRARSNCLRCTLAELTNIGGMWKTCCGWSTALLASASILAQVQSPAVLRVSCVDTDGRPVAGAEVHVFQWRKMPDDFKSVVAGGPFTSGDDGVASTITAIDYDGGRFDRWVYARVPGKLVGALRRARFGDDPVDPKLVVELRPSRELRGRVRVPDGVSCEAVRIRVLTLAAIVGDDLWGQVFPRQLGIPALADVLPERFDCRAAADGSFVLADMPAEPFVVLAAEGPGLALALWGNAMLPERRIPDQIELELAPESRFGGVLVDARDHPVTDAEVELCISMEAHPRPLATLPFVARTDAAGRFRLDGLPAGPFELFVRSAAGVRRPQRVALARAGAQLAAKVALEDGVEVAGVVTANPGGEPVAEVMVTAITPDNLQLNLGYRRTDSQGRFTMRLPSGKAKLYFSSVPRGFTYPDPQIVATLDVEPTDQELRQLRLEVPRAQ